MGHLMLPLLSFWTFFSQFCFYDFLFILNILTFGGHVLYMCCFFFFNSLCWALGVHFQYEHEVLLFWKHFLITSLILSPAICLLVRCWTLPRWPSGFLIRIFHLSIFLFYFSEISQIWFSNFSIKLFSMLTNRSLLSGRYFLVRIYSIFTGKCLLHVATFSQISLRMYTRV